MARTRDGAAQPPFDPERPPDPSSGEFRREDSVRPFVNAVLDLLEAAGPEALPSLRDWPRELIARSLPVVSALQGLSRYAAPRTLRLFSIASKSQSPVTEGAAMSRI